MTRGHRDDMRVLQLAIATPARYIAMIGSKRKVLNVIRELEKEGIPRAAFERIHAPMGLDIGAISPEEIAISVAAEMIAVRRNAAVQLALALHVGIRRRPGAGRALEVSVAGIILAAGESRRMGFPKALLRYRDETFLDTLIGLFAARCQPVIVVLGAHSDRIRERTVRPATFVDQPGLSARPDQFHAVRSARRARPMRRAFSSPWWTTRPSRPPRSMRCSPSPAAGAIRLRWSACRATRGRRGHPIWFSRDLIAEFLALPENGAARDVVRSHAAQTEFLDVDDPGILADIDDAAAYGRLTGATL